MHSRRLAAVAIAAILAGHAALTASPAAAADLSGDPYDGRHSGAFDDSPYDDPRYADIYRHPPRRAEPAPRFEPRDDYDDEADYGDDTAPRHAYRGPDRDRGYLRPMPGVPRFAQGRGDGCVPRDVVKRRLRADGWHDFHDLELDGALALVRARRPSGRLFELRIDRCSGAIVDARPYGPGPRRYRGYS